MSASGHKQTFGKHPPSQLYPNKRTSIDATDMIPVTNAAKQENTRRILMIGKASPTLATEL
jgi:hypothetical protein